MVNFKFFDFESTEAGEALSEKWGEAGRVWRPLAHAGPTWLPLKHPVRKAAWRELCLIIMAYRTAELIATGETAYSKFVYDPDDESATYRNGPVDE